MSIVLSQQRVQHHFLDIIMSMKKTILNAIGNTPLVQLWHNSAAKIYAKLEYCNPGGSIKDRSALYLVEKAEQEGRLKPGYTIIDASSGNHGIALAMIGATKGYPVIICSSQKVSFEKLNAMRAYGAEVVVCPPTDFIDDPASYHSRAVALGLEVPNSCMLNQYFSPLNAQAHYHLTGPEIWQQTKGTITHFFAAAGTGGTISGVGRYLKEQNPAIKIIAIDSNNSYRATNGNPKPYCVEGMGIDFDSPVIDYNLFDEIICVTDDEAIGMARTLAHTSGMLIGPSSGAVAYAVSTYQPKLSKDAVVVALLGDSGRAYLTKQLAQQEMTPSFQAMLNASSKLSSEGSRG